MTDIKEAYAKLQSEYERLQAENKQLRCDHNKIAAEAIRKAIAACSPTPATAMGTIMDEAYNGCMEVLYDLTEYARKLEEGDIDA